MKRKAIKPAITTILFIILLLKTPMSKSIELSNIYSIVISTVVSLFVICLIILDSWDNGHIKDIENLDLSLLKKYKALSALIVLLITLETILVLLKSNMFAVKLTQTLLLIIAFLVLWIRGRYAQGTQTKFSTKEIAMYLILFLLSCFSGLFLKDELSSQVCHFM